MLANSFEQHIVVVEKVEKNSRSKCNSCTMQQFSCYLLLAADTVSGEEWS